jgi:hypothetical protein
MRRTKCLLTAVAVATAVFGCSPASTSTGSPTGSIQTDDDVHHQPNRGRRVVVDRVHGSLSSRISALPVGVPLPSGLVTSITSGPARWSVLMVVHGSARRVQANAVAFYVAHAFGRDSAYVVHSKEYEISMIAENRDHSTRDSNLTLVVTHRPGPG